MRKLGVTPELVSLLNNTANQVMADCYTITLGNGTVLRYTSADRPIIQPAANNQQTHSEDLVNWPTSVAMGILANSIVDPIGGTTATNLRPTAANSAHSITAPAVTTTAATWTRTFYTLATGISGAYPWLLASFNGLSACLNVFSGGIGLTSGGVSVISTNMGGGYFRWDITYTASAGSFALQLSVNTTNALTASTYAGNGTDGIGVFGVMAYAGAVFIRYVKTIAAVVNSPALTFLRGPTFQRDAISHKIGVEVSTLQVDIGVAGVTVSPDQPADMIGSLPFVQYVLANGLDGAAFKLERAFMTAWGQPPAGLLIDFAGRVTSILGITELLIPLTVSSWTVLFNVNMPPDLFQAACLNTLFDPNCQVAQTGPFVVTGATVSAGASTSAFNTNLSAADGYFSQGRITFTSGANNGLTRAVKTHVNASGRLTLLLPLPVAPANGDTFTAYAGDDKTLATCTTKFSNRIHYRGTPFVPPVETAV